MLEWIISSSILIVFIIVLRLILKGKISQRLQYAVWIIVLLRLLIPVSFGNAAFSAAGAVESVLGIAQTGAGYTLAINGEGRSEGNGQTVRDEPAEDANSSDSILYNEGSASDAAAYNTSPADSFANHSYAAGSQGSGQRGVAVSARNHSMRIIAVIWAAGSAMILLWFAICNIRFLMALKNSRTEVEQSISSLRVYTSDRIDTPCLFGLFLPSIYITRETAEDSVMLRHVIIHEEMHFRHGDHIISLLKTVALAIHWFNPLVWLAFFLSKKDCELACDESVVIRLGESERAAYGHTLINMTAVRRSDIMLAATMMTGTKKTLYERIHLISGGEKRPVALAVIAAICVLCAAGCTFAGTAGTGQVVESGDSARFGDIFGKEYRVEGGSLVPGDPLPREESERMQIAMAGLEIVYDYEEASDRLISTCHMGEPNNWIILPVSVIEETNDYSAVPMEIVGIAKDNIGSIYKPYFDDYYCTKSLARWLPQQRLDLLLQIK